MWFYKENDLHFKDGVNPVWETREEAAKEGHVRTNLIPPRCHTKGDDLFPETILVMSSIKYFLRFVSWGVPRLWFVYPKGKERESRLLWV